MRPLPIAITVVVILLIAGGLFFALNSGTSEADRAVQAAEEAKGYEVITVDVTDNGFSPEKISVKAGVPTKINFRKDTSYTCIKDVKSSALGMNNMKLDKGDNYYTLEDLKPGTYEYNCGMYMYYGKISVN